MLSQKKFSQKNFKTPNHLAPRQKFSGRRILGGTNVQNRFSQIFSQPRKGESLEAKIMTEKGIAEFAKKIDQKYKNKS
jgi:hypothetical protein